jgi:hypothetical protein
MRFLALLGIKQRPNDTDTQELRREEMDEERRGEERRGWEYSRETAGARVVVLRVSRESQAELSTSNLGRPRLHVT